MNKILKANFILPFLLLFIIAIILMFTNFTGRIVGTVLIIFEIAWLISEFKIDNMSQNENIIEGLDKVYKKFDELNRLKMNQLPVGYVIVDKNGKIIWFNEAFFQAFYNDENTSDTDIKGRNIENEINLSLEECLDAENLEYSYHKVDYEIVTQKITDSRGDLYIINFFDITLLKRQKEIYKRYEPVFCYITIDNYDETIDPLAAYEKANIISQIDLHLNEWADRKDAFIIRLENDRYLVIFEREKLNVMVEAHFTILDEIRDIPKELNSNIPLSLSIGIGVSNKPRTIKEADEMSHTALEMAQARGGDQAVVKIDEDINYYGGRNEAAARHNKVKARIKAQALKEIMKEADNIFIMGHKNPDLDCIGAAFGLIDAAHDLNKKARYVLTESNYSIQSFLSSLKDHEEYKDVVVTPEEAEFYKRKNSLLIIVDTDKVDYVDYPPLIDSIEKKVIIDHHRRPDNAISPTVLDYTEVYASSASELVTELLSYFDSKTVLTPFGASVLMAGIYMDTKMFMNRTGVRTFEAASYLKRRGADMNQASLLLADDFIIYSKRMKVIQNAEILNDDSIAISMYKDNSDYAKIISAQAADEMLNIKNIKASFVILLSNGVISISGRSRRDINVQLILEGLGGGGHFNMAGAQLADVDDLQEAKKLLVEQINEYLEGRTEIENNIA